MITHYVGLSLGANSTVESGVAVREASSNELIYVDKFFSMSDIESFFNNYVSINNSVICVSLPWDITMLEGKWRVHSKAYQLINSNNNFKNIDNWMQRFSTRGCDLLNTISEKYNNIYRYEIYLTRLKFNLYSNYKERSSDDCKYLQSALKQRFSFYNFPPNMMPAAQLEAILGTLLGEEYCKNNTEDIFRFKNLSVINLK